MMHSWFIGRVRRAAGRGGWRLGVVGAVVVSGAVLVSSTSAQDAFPGPPVVPPGAVEMALTPEEASGSEEPDPVTQPEDFGPFDHPLLVPDERLLARLKQQAEAGVPDEESAGDTAVPEDPEDSGAPTEEPEEGPLDLPGDTSPDTSDEIQTQETDEVRNRQGLRGSRRNNSVPPDATGAVSPRAYVEMVNRRIALYGRGLARRADTSLRAFTGSRVGDDVFDPQVQWDPQANRFFYLAARRRGETNFVSFGWSRTANPRNLTRRAWCRFFYRTGGLFEDYPKLGHSDNHLIFASNVFADDEQTFVTSRISALPKPPNGSTTCTRPARTIFGTRDAPLLTADGDLAFTPVPANTFTASPVGPVVAADLPAEGAPGDQIMVWTVGGPPAAPVLVANGNVAVGQYEVPPAATQPDNRRRLDTLDTRLTQAVADIDPDAADLAVWTQHTVRAPDGRSVVRWYEILPATLVARQQGDIATRRRFVFNGAISPTTAGNSAAINYNVSSRRLRVRIRARSRDAATPLGEMTSEVTLARSAGSARDFTCFDDRPACRWGDYAGASPDPSSNTLVWGSNQYQGRPEERIAAWRTRNFALRVTPDEEPVPTGGS